MYTKKDFKAQVDLLYHYYREPIKLLMDQSGLAKPTVWRFLKGEKLRTYNQDKLIECVICLNEKAIAKRKSLRDRGNKVIQLELDLLKSKKINKGIHKI
ncbi:hypothetical protein HN014_04445 [Aquimarina sp. TRL1]|uniref:hypothetical protein n=1 Tax=Aquimarina sp. (strain TRL1) TaxID=2736252 RepID=UPI0015897612|nr:hypothetical protein [Aquimarina sp. TRL1]QKX04188.1 hypothetical protein HN014_04445 [Aquimarina sp. TRL1]